MYSILINLNGNLIVHVSVIYFSDDLCDDFNEFYGNLTVIHLLSVIYFNLY